MSIRLTVALVGMLTFAAIAAAAEMSEAERAGLAKDAAAFALRCNGVTAADVNLSHQCAADRAAIEERRWRWDADLPERAKGYRPGTAANMSADEKLEARWMEHQRRCKDVTSAERDLFRQCYDEDIAFIQSFTGGRP